MNLKVVSFLALTITLIVASCEIEEGLVIGEAEEESAYLGPDTTEIPDGPEGDMIRYGRDLILFTAKLIGPEGTEGVGPEDQGGEDGRGGRMMYVVLARRRRK